MQGRIECGVFAYACDGESLVSGGKGWETAGRPGSRSARRQVILLVFVWGTMAAAFVGDAGDAVILDRMRSDIGVKVKLTLF